MRIVRVELDDGTRLVGLRYPEILVDQISKIALPTVPDGQQHIKVPDGFKWTVAVETNLRTRTRSQYQHTFSSVEALDSYIETCIVLQKASMRERATQWVEARKAERQAAQTRAEQQHRAFTPLHAQDATPVDPKSLKKATTKPKTLLNFFMRSTSASSAKAPKSKAAEATPCPAASAQTAPTEKKRAVGQRKRKAEPATSSAVRDAVASKHIAESDSSPAMEISAAATDADPLVDRKLEHPKQELAAQESPSGLSKKPKLCAKRPSCSPWLCSACTFENTTRPSRCEVCGTVRHV